MAIGMIFEEKDLKKFVQFAFKVDHPAQYILYNTKLYRYKQFNGFPNSEGQSIAMNIWFRHSHEHSPVCRPTSDLSSTLDQYDFSDDQDIEGEEEEEDDGEIDEEPRQRPKNKYL